MQTIEFFTKRKTVWLFTDTVDSTILNYLQANCPVNYRYTMRQNPNTKEKMLELKFKTKDRNALVESVHLAHNKVLLTGYHTYDKDNEKAIKMIVKEEHYNIYVKEIG